MLGPFLLIAWMKSKIAHCLGVCSNDIWTHPVFPLLPFNTLGAVSFSWNPQGAFSSCISIQLFNPERQAVQGTIFVVNGGDPDRRLNSGGIFMNGALVAGHGEIRGDNPELSFPLAILAGFSTLTISTTGAKAEEPFLFVE